MRPSAAHVVALCLALLACASWEARAGLIEEFREGWEKLYGVPADDQEGYERLFARMEQLVSELSQSGGAGQDVLVEHLLIPTRPVWRSSWQLDLPHAKIKVAIVEEAARHGRRQVVPALISFLASDRPPPNTPEFESYGILIVAAAKALPALRGREAVPAVRQAFLQAFEQSRGAWAAATLRQLPSCLVALGDNAWLEDRLIEWLNGEIASLRGQAAFVAQHTLGERIVPHLIAYRRETGDAKAVWALRQISGRAYPGVESWEAWWTLNAATPRDGWTGLPSTSAWKGVWTRDLFATIEEQFLCNNRACWRKAGYAEGPAEAALEMAHRIQALGIELTIVERLTAMLGSDAGASCCRIWGAGDGMTSARTGEPARRRDGTVAPVSKSVAPRPDPYCGCSDSLPVSHYSVAGNAEWLLKAIDCVAGKGPCEEFRTSDVRVDVVATAGPTAEASGAGGSGPIPRRAVERPHRSVDPEPIRGISFEISLAGSGTRRAEHPVVGESIPIRCVWRNTGQRPLPVDLKDHDAHQGTLDYPVSLSARVLDRSGAVLTENEVAEGGWWSSYLLWTTPFERMPGDVVMLHPGEEVVRIVPLERVLSGLDRIEGGLGEGRYAVQFNLGQGELVSNLLEIEIRVE